MVPTYLRLLPRIAAVPLSPWLDQLRGFDEKEGRRVVFFDVCFWAWESSSSLRSSPSKRLTLSVPPPSFKVFSPSWVTFSSSVRPGTWPQSKGCFVSLLQRVGFPSVFFPTLLASLFCPFWAPPLLLDGCMSERPWTGQRIIEICPIHKP